MENKEQFYPEGAREKIIDMANAPENRFRGITEATGLRILDGIYILIEMLRKE